MIISSAIKLSNGSVFVGKRHGDCYQAIRYITQDKESCKGSIQGFLTDKLEFLNREEAYYHAFACGQCKEQMFNQELYEKCLMTGLDIPRSESDWIPTLASEDLW